MAAPGGMPDPKNMNEEEKAAVLAMMKNEMDYKFGLLYRYAACLLEWWRVVIVTPSTQTRASAHTLTHTCTALDYVHSCSRAG